MLKPSEIREIVDSHDAYWDDKRPHLRKLRDAYLTKFWKEDTIDSNYVLRTEVSRGYAVVESYLGSLYSKNPSVEVQPDIRARGNPEVAEAVSNLYLQQARPQIEDATRLALIYPCSYVKLAPVDNVDPLKRVSVTAIPPWEIIVDSTSGSWEQQRWVGHSYMMPVPEAEIRYGVSNDELRGYRYSRWIEGLEHSTAQDDGTPSEDKWIRVVEVYDLVSDKLLIWSPDYLGGDDYLFEGVTVQIGALPDDPEAEDADDEIEVVHETTGIPYKTASGRPVVPIVPMYLSREPDDPLRGYSLMDRIYDQLREINVMRTYQSQGVRRMARQWLVRAGFLSEDAAAKLSQGLDGEVIEVDLQPGEGLEGNIIPAPQAPIPADIALYAATVENDISAAGLLAPFTRGEVTKSTATEQELLAAYTSSEIGRMARVRDQVITDIAKTYTIMLSVIMGDDAEPLMLPNPVGPTILSADDLTGDFTWWAVDAGQTPMSDMTKRRNLAELSPLLIQLGADPQKILEELVRTYQLPDTLAQPPEAPEAPELPADAFVAPEGGEPTTQALTPIPNEVL